MMDDDQELRDGLTEKKLHEERILRRSSYCWTQPRRDQDRVGIPCHRPPLKEDGNYSGRTDELWCLPHFSSCCLPGPPGPLRFCCTVPSALTDYFSRGDDPYTHACKARPLTVVGRTSLSVIVICCHSFGLPALPLCVTTHAKIIPEITHARGRGARL